MKNDKEEVILGRKGRQLHTAKAGGLAGYILIFTLPYSQLLAFE